MANKKEHVKLLIKDLQKWNKNQKTLKKQDLATFNHLILMLKLTLNDSLDLCVVKDFEKIAIDAANLLKTKYELGLWDSFSIFTEVAALLNNPKRGEEQI